MEKGAKSSHHGGHCSGAVMPAIQSEAFCFFLFVIFYAYSQILTDTLSGRVNTYIYSRVFRG